MALAAAWPASSKQAVATYTETGGTGQTAINQSEAVAERAESYYQLGLQLVALGLFREALYCTDRVDRVWTRMSSRFIVSGVIRCCGFMMAKAPRPAFVGRSP